MKTENNKKYALNVHCKNSLMFPNSFMLHCPESYNVTLVQSFLFGSLYGVGNLHPPSFSEEISVALMHEVGKNADMLA